MYRNFAHGKILKVVRILCVASVEGVISDASDYESCWELPGNGYASKFPAGMVYVLHTTRLMGYLENPDSSAFARAKKTDEFSCTLRTNKTALMILTF